MSTDNHQDVALPSELQQKHQNIQAAARQRVRPRGIMTYPSDYLLEAVIQICEQERRSFSFMYDQAMREMIARRNQMQGGTQT